MLTVRKHSSKSLEIHSFLELFPRFPFDVLEDVKKSEFQNLITANNLNGGERTVIYKQNISPDDCKSIATLSFSQNVGLKMVAMQFHSK